MKYIDTDVLVHSLINQNAELHLKTVDLIKEIVNDNEFLISWLSLQETAFVLAKLGQPISFISEKLKFLTAFTPVEYNGFAFARAAELGEIIGFKDFNDCLHTAIAEQHCTDLYTFNHKDFKRIKFHTSLKIHFL